MFELRPFQKQALEALDDGTGNQKHILCIAPTGAGKSLIYEKAAQRPQRRTVLITPLVALARQQHQKLSLLGVRTQLGAGGQNSQAPTSETEAWIMSPEMLRFPSRRKSLFEWRPNLLVVDECHCLWEWGENFRPAFSLVPDLLTELDIPKSIWLTATLPYEARQNLKVHISYPLTEIGGFELPSRLILTIQKTEWKYRTQALLNWTLLKKEPGIVFVPTREATLRISRLLMAAGKNVIAYHGGMSSEERRNAELLIQKAIPDVVVATSAFGMGMDYPHLRYVVLWQAPTSILSLVQAVGRVGRNPQTDGNALILWDQEDIRMLEWTIQNSKKRLQELNDLFIFLSSKECRRSALKLYFDRTIMSETCGKCDTCRSMRHHY
jgi:ATP-dependent DNA helicase RecQ